MERVDEIRLEAVVGSGDIAEIVAAIRASHPYEEPAFDLYPLRPQPVRGIGRIGALAQPTTLAQLARKLKRATHSSCVQIVGPADRRVARAVIVGGSAGTLPFRVALGSNDVVVTGEIRHHDALTIRRHDATAIALGHWASERPVLEPLAHKLTGALKGITFRISKFDRDAFEPV